MNPYTPPPLFFNRHIETIYPSLIRKVEFRPAQRERITTPDDDFLDLDWYHQQSAKCVIISHGLEGNSQRSYMRGMAKVFFQAGYDVLTWNFRGCSGEINRQPRFYHSGATDDLHTVVLHTQQRYDQLFLIGFSLGGNLTLKYLGEAPPPTSIKRAVAFSVPLNLHTSCLLLSKNSNWIYSRRFLRKLVEKLKSKPSLQKVVDLSQLNQIKTMMEFDDHFTGPLHGFKDALDYYAKCSSLHFLQGINVPTLVVNAKNDPLLSADCFPTQQYAHITFEFPERGGHVGFAMFGHNGLYWSEMRALAFIESKE